MRHTRIIFAACTLLIAFLPLRAQTSAPTPVNKRATVKVGKATVATTSADDSLPQLISTTGGRDGDKAKTWDSAAALQKAADSGDPDACYELGNQYLTGSKDVPQNATRAMLYFEDAARKGNRDAAFRLGKMYAEGTQLPQDYEKAVGYYTAAARAGDAIAQHNLGAMYANGRGVKRDYAEGLAWLITAARRAPEAVDGGKKLRDFLTRINRPDLIVTGEARARELTQELAAAKATGKSDTHPPANTTTPPAIKIEPIKIEPAKMQPPSLQDMILPSDIGSGT